MTTTQLFNSNNYNNTNKNNKANYYTQEQYLEALEHIQFNTYTSIQKAWGQRWRQNLAKAMPLVLKLLRYGYNDFLVQRISSGNFKWICYDENTALSLLEANHISSEAYYLGVCYPKMGIHRNNKPYVKEWRKLMPFVNRQSYQADSKAMLLIIKDLIKVGAMAKVADSFIVKETCEKFSTSYIISKDRLRELVSLFISTFSSILTHSSISTNTTYNTIHSLYGDTSGGTLGKMGHFDTLLAWNNDQLPEDEKLSFTGRRAYAQVNSYINEDKHDTIAPGAMTIQKYCNKVFGEDNWLEFDRRGSIYNLTRTLNGRGYLENTTDIYELMNGRPFVSKEERKYFKLTQMMCYFSTPMRFRGMLNRVYGAIAAGKPTTCDNWDMAKSYYNLLGCPDTDWNSFVDMAIEDFKRRQALMKKVIGQNKIFIDPKGKRTPIEDKNPGHIFVHESKAYMIFVTKLREMGIRVVQVYDGFAMPKNCGLTEEELDKMLNDSINEYIEKYYSQEN